MTNQLMVQIDALSRSLDQARTTLLGQSGAQGAKLLKEIRGNLSNRLTILQNECTLLSSEPDSGSLESAWKKLSDLQRGAADLLKECLAFCEGALARDAGLDQGLCALADAMLSQISKNGDLGWERFTLVAPGEFFSNLSGIIRLRFTDTDVWNLPVAAHELGHFVSALPDFADFQQFVTSEKRKDSRYEGHLRELFSDLFATYSTGLCFPLNCGLLRFNPAEASTMSATHPSHAQRMWWMLTTLAKMDEGEPEPLYGLAVNRLREDWAAALKSAGHPESLTDVEVQRLQIWHAMLWDWMEARKPICKYSNLLRARDMARSFAGRQAPALRAGDSIPDILNAVWHFRLFVNRATPYEVEKAGENALKLCETIANGLST